MGQGLHTKMIQVASRTLRIPPEKIHISETSTNTVPNTSPTAASTGSDLNGMAVKVSGPRRVQRPTLSLNGLAKRRSWSGTGVSRSYPLFQCKLSTTLNESDFECLEFSEIFFTQLNTNCIQKTLQIDYIALLPRKREVNYLILESIKIICQAKHALEISLSIVIVTTHQNQWRLVHGYPFVCLS